MSEDNSTHEKEENKVLNDVALIIEEGADDVAPIIEEISEIEKLKEITINCDDFDFNIDDAYTRKKENQ